MKKVLLFLAAAAMLAVSCAKDPQGLIGDQTKVTFTVDASQVATRAVTGTHGTATRLMVGVYIKSGTTYNYIQAISQSNTVSEWPTVVSLDLAKNETYKLVFWADEGTDAYTINWTNGTVAEAATTIAGNATNRDAYYKMVEITTNGANGGAITLTRPLAQVNVGTNDLAAYKAAAVYDGNIETQVVVSGVVPGMNLLTGEASTGDPVDLTFSYADNLDATLVSGGNDYGYLGMNFVLCPADNTLTAGISIRKDGATENINTFQVSNMPVKTNYRTNVVGKLLTGIVEYTVDVDTDFADDLQKQVAPSFASVADLNAYFATMADNSDHGDIEPEVVTLTTIADGDAIVLPAISGSVVIRIPAVLETGTLSIGYAASGDKPANVSLFVRKLEILQATVPASHFELLSGSFVTNKAIVSTNTTTFVIQNGARVGTAEIQKGNATIAGTVATVTVPTGAKADDDNNPVYVFLEKESAVDQIVLQAKTDVVVEQPKDQIEVDDTERKVAVYVQGGAENSTATAQNGGVIYVKAEVPCTVTADGTSEAEDGSAVASTVIIEPGAAGSAVVATKGASVVLTANANCSASAEGVAEEDPETSSTITVTKVKDENIVIDANASEGGEIETNPETLDAVKYFVARIGDVKYESIEEAISVVQNNQTIVMLVNITQDDGILFDKEGVNAAIDLDGKTIKVNNGSNVNSRAFRIDNGTLEVYGGSIVAVGEGTNADNGTGCYGAFRVEANGVLNAHDLSLSNARPWGLNVKVIGGAATLDNVSITSSYGGGIEVTEADLGNNSKAGSAILKNCHFTQTGYYDHCSTTLSVSGGSALTINGGSYESDNYALYVFSSGGEITVNDGSFSGNKDGVAIIAAIDLNTYPNYTGGLKLKGGEFHGGYSITSPAYMEVTGGTFSEDPSAYVDLNDYKVEENAGMYTVSPIPVFHITNETELQQAFDEGHVKMLLENDIEVENPHTLTLNSGKTANLIMPYCINNSSNLSFVINGNLNITGCGEIWNGENLTVSGTGNIDIASTISGSNEYGPFSYEGFFDNSKAMVMENVTITSDVVPFTAIANSSNGTLSMTNVKMYIEDRGIFSNGGGNVTLNSVDFECFYRACFRSQFSENAEVTVTDSKLLSHSYYWNEYNGTVGGAYNQTFQMNGGGHATITNTEIGGVHGAISISKSNNVPSSATINSGRFYTFNPEAPTVKEQVYGAIYLYYSSVIINGGEFIAGGGYPSLRFYGGNAEINGGKFGVGSYNMTPIEYLDAYTLSVKGGWFAKKIEDKYLANGYQWVESGDATYPWAVEQIQ